jgi:O-antigen/teichoic acid export membrane protein
MAAEIMMGVYFNLSFWYKLIDKTIWGAIFSGIGCTVLIAINIIFVPRYGYVACAWGGFAGYGVAMLTSYFVGQKYYPINYPIKDMTIYVIASAIIYTLMNYCNSNLAFALSLGINTLLIVAFMALIVKMDMPLNSLPIIGKKFKK